MQVGDRIVITGGYPDEWEWGRTGKIKTIHNDGEIDAVLDYDGMTPKEREQQFRDDFILYKGEYAVVKEDYEKETGIAEA